MLRHRAGRAPGLLPANLTTMGPVRSHGLLCASNLISAFTMAFWGKFLPPKPPFWGPRGHFGTLGLHFGVFLSSGAGLWTPWGTFWEM